MAIGLQNCETFQKYETLFSISMQVFFGSYIDILIQLSINLKLKIPSFQFRFASDIIVVISRPNTRERDLAARHRYSIFETLYFFTEIKTQKPEIVLNSRLEMETLEHH